MVTFLFIHGAFQGAWCWRKLIPEIEARGHRGVAIDLPSLGDDQTPLAEATLGLWIDRTVEAIRAQAEPVILVGHSLGGMVIAGAAERIPERVRLLVYLAAFLPIDGDTALSASAVVPPPKDPGPSAFKRAPDGIGLLVRPEAAPDRFYGQCSEADIAYAVAHLRPLAFGVQKEAVHLTPARYGSVPRAYIECLEDRAVALDLQRAMVGRASCKTVLSLPTDHSPFFSAPARLADSLVALDTGT